MIKRSAKQFCNELGTREVDTGQKRSNWVTFPVDLPFIVWVVILISTKRAVKELGYIKSLSFEIALMS